MQKPKKNVVIAAGLGVALAVAACSKPEESKPSVESTPADSTGAPTLQLTDSQLQSIKIGPVGRHAFPEVREAVGSIDFDENLSVQVFSPYQGKIIMATVQLGDVVNKGQTLYTIDSPDLVQAESTLISAAAQLELTTKELQRAKNLYLTNKGVAERELEQAISDQQTAEGALKAARDAVRVFGKTESEIDRVVEARKIDPSLVVPSPIDGQITARNAQPGLLVQPGNAPAPYSVADISTKWMLASVMESDAPLIHVGESVDVFVMAYPGRTFSGTIVTVGATVDPVLHRVTTRTDVLDPKHELLPGMIATFQITVQDAKDSLAIPVNGVVWEGDGSMTAWVTPDRHHFTQRVLKVGVQRDGWRQILGGLGPKDLVVTNGAVFVSNLLKAPPADD